jgi:hypothetical protein
MIIDSFHYCKGCEECPKFGKIQLAPAAMTQQKLMGNFYEKHWDNDGDVERFCERNFFSCC